MQRSCESYKIVLLISVQCHVAIQSVSDKLDVARLLSLFILLAIHIKCQVDEVCVHRLMPNLSHIYRCMHACITLAHVRVNVKTARAADTGSRIADPRS